MTRVRFHRRPGFTLVEILVVMAIIILVAGLTVAIANSGVAGSWEVTGAADRLSQWLLISKQRAARDGAARGVRVLLTQPDPVNDPFRYVGTEVQYVEVPEPWVPNPTQELNPTGGRIVFVYTKVTAATPTEPLDSVPNNNTYRRVFFVSRNTQDITDFDQKVAQGSLLILPEFGSQYRIALNPAVAPNLPVPIVDGDPNLGGAGETLSAANCRELILGLPPAVAGGPVTTFTYPDLGAGHSNPAPLAPGEPIRATWKTYKFAFQPGPAPILGEPMLQVSGSAIVDYRAPGGGGIPVASLDADGYRDWRTPAPPPIPAGAFNPAPYWPSTTIGVPLHSDSSGAYLEVLFSPTGQVMYNPKGIICFWVREPERLQDAGYSHPRLGDPLPYAAPTQLDLRRQLYDNAGDQKLVVVYTRTGMIATHDVAPPPQAPSPAYDPYQYAKDGLNSGL